MAQNTLIARDVDSFLEKFGGNYIAAYNEIVAEADAKALAERPKSNAEVRKAAYTKALHKLDAKELKSMRKTVGNFLPLAEENAGITAEAGVLEESDAYNLMVEVLEVKRMEEFVKARYESIRKRVFSAITEELAAEGEDFPEFMPGYIPVPQLGLKFTREGGGRKDPELDEAKLESILGPEVWEKVTTTEHIPAQEVQHFSIDLYLQEARRQPELLEKLRAALKVGDFKPVKFNQRALDIEE